MKNAEWGRGGGLLNDDYELVITKSKTKCKKHAIILIKKLDENNVLWILIN